MQPNSSIIKTKLPSERSMESKTAQTYNNYTESIKLGSNQEQEMETHGNELSSCEVTHQSMSAQIKLATEPILRD